MRTKYLCISVIRVASGPREKLVGCKSALNPLVVYSIDRSKAVVLVLFLLFVALRALWFPHCFLLFFFYMCCEASNVVTVFNSCQLFVLLVVL